MSLKNYQAGFTCCRTFYIAGTIVMDAHIKKLGKAVKIRIYT